MPGTVHLHRIIAAPPQKVYRAFTEPDAMAQWIPPYGFLCTVEEMVVRVGGKHRASFRNFTTGASHAFGGEDLEVVPNERLRYSDVFDDPNLPGEIVVTVEFRPVIVGTALSITQEGIPDVIPVEMCELGWQDSLEKLTRLVTPEINQ